MFAGFVASAVCCMGKPMRRIALFVKRLKRIAKIGVDFRIGLVDGDGVKTTTATAETMDGASKVQSRTTGNDNNERQTT